MAALGISFHSAQGGVGVSISMRWSFGWSDEIMCTWSGCICCAVLYLPVDGGAEGVRVQLQVLSAQISLSRVTSAKSRCVRQSLLFFRMKSGETFSKDASVSVSRPLSHAVHPTLPAAGGSFCTPATGSVWGCEFVHEHACILVVYLFRSADSSSYKPRVS